MNCSSTAGRVAMRERRCALRVGGALLLIVVSVGARGETEAEIEDAAARMQYAFYTGDAQALEEVLRLVEDFDVDGRLAPAKSYQLAYGHWKLAQLYADPVSEDRPVSNAKSLAKKAAQACVRDAQAAIDGDAAMGEAYAIEAVCDGFSPGAHGATGSAACSRSKSLRKALSLLPDNPRVHLIEAMCADDDSDPAELDRWRAVVTAFEAAPPARPGTPDWGHVEALTQLGRIYLKRGDPVAARDALERALVLAPDYKVAQKLLQTAAVRPR